MAPYQKWLLGAAISGYIVRFVTAFRMYRGDRVDTNLATVIFIGSAALISAYCMFMIGDRTPTTWIIPLFFIFLLLGYALVLKAKRPRPDLEPWQEQDRSFMGIMSGGGLIVGALVAMVIILKARS